MGQDPRNPGFGPELWAVFQDRVTLGVRRPPQDDPPPPLRKFTLRIGPQRIPCRDVAGPRYTEHLFVKSRLLGRRQKGRVGGTLARRGICLDLGHAQQSVSKPEEPLPSAPGSIKVGQAEPKAWPALPLKERNQRVGTG